MLLPVLNRFLHWMIVGVISPVIVLMIASKGATLSEVGLIMAILSSFVVVFELPSGILSDRLGRKRIYLLSLTFLLAAYTMLLFAQGFWPVALAFGIAGVARAFSSGSIESDFIDQYLNRHGGDKLSKLILGMNIGETLGLALGAVLGGFLPSLTTQVDPSVNPYSGNLVVQLLLVALVLVLTLTTHKANRKKEHEPMLAFLKQATTLVAKSRTLVVLLVGAMVWGFAFFALEVYWQPQLKNVLGPTSSTEVFGFLNGAYFIAAALGTLAASKAISLFRLKDVVAVGLLRIFLGLGLVFLGLQSGLTGFAVVYLLLMGFNGMLSVPEATVFNLSIPEDKRSSLLSLSSLVMQLGGILASVIFSLIVAGVGIPMVLVMAGTLFALSSILYFGLARR